MSKVTLIGKRPIANHVTRDMLGGKVTDQGANGEAAWQVLGGGIAGGNPACPGTGSCFEANPTPGCDDEECCNTVCMFSDFCCEFGWDEFCVFDAGILCDTTCDPGDPPPGALYSNASIKCLTGDAFVHDTALEIIADDLWWQNGGGIILDVGFSVVNFAESDLVGGTMVVYIFAGQPGSDDGAFDPSVDALEIEIDLEGIDLEAGFGGLFAVDISDAEVGIDTLPGAWGGVQYVDAMFSGAGAATELGQFLVNPPAAGMSGDVFWVQDFGLAFFGGDPVANFVFEIITDESGETDTLFDTGPNQPLFFNGTLTNLGWSAGNVSADLPQRWSAMPFTLPELAAAGANEWNITGIFPSGFIPADAVADQLTYKVWARNGFNQPVAGDLILEATVTNPRQLNNPLNGSLASVTPVFVDFNLAPGDYYLTVHGVNSTGGLSNYAWFANPVSPIVQVNEQGPWHWRSAMFPSPGFQVYQLGPPTLEPDPEQADPNTTHAATFFLKGRPVGDEPTTCPEDLNNDGVVNVFDLLILLGAWGSCPGCPEDLNNDGVVNVFDLLILLGAWGTCP